MPLACHTIAMPLYSFFQFQCVLIYLAGAKYVQPNTMYEFLCWFRIQFKYNPSKYRITNIINNRKSNRITFQKNDFLCQSVSVIKCPSEWAEILSGNSIPLTMRFEWSVDVRIFRHCASSDPTIHKHISRRSFVLCAWSFYCNLICCIHRKKTHLNGHLTL